jgi:endoglucanase
MSSAELVADMAPGWNLGDTLDACDTSDPSAHPPETYWGNPAASEELFLALKEDGIRAIRIPVTWRHYIGPAPNYIIDSARMDWVQEVVDYAIKNELYAIINLHHDGGGDLEGGAWIKGASTDEAGVTAKYKAVWAQIADRFKDYNHRLVFESMNEVGFDDMPINDAYALLNRLNQTFTDLVRGSGGNNGTRHLLISGYWTDFTRSAELANTGCIQTRTKPPGCSGWRRPRSWDTTWAWHRFSGTTAKKWIAILSNGERRSCWPPFCAPRAAKTTRLPASKNQNVF